MARVSYTSNSHTEVDDQYNGNYDRYGNYRPAATTPAPVTNDCLETSTSFVYKDVPDVTDYTSWEQPQHNYELVIDL